MSINLVDKALAVLRKTLDDTSQEKQVADTSELISLLGFLIDTVDDEVLYTMPDVETDLRASLWNAAGGFYKSSASCMRNALDVGMAGLHFLIRSDKGDGSFLQWNQGDINTPNWSVMKTTIDAVPTVGRFNKEQGVEISNLVHSHFKMLCSYTHSRPYSPDKVPSNVTSMDGGAGPSFSNKEFDRMLSLCRTTMRHLGTVWLVAYPNILASQKFDAGAKRDFSPLLDDPLSDAAYNLALACAVKT